jgi:hypothetical protein
VRYIWLACVFAQFVLEFGIQPIPLKIKLSDVFLDAHMRVELLGLNSGRLPCFDAIAVSLMSKPTVDFSLRVANLVDIMSIPDLTRLFMPAFGPTPTPAAGTTGARPEAKAMLGKFASALVSVDYEPKYRNALCPISILGAWIEMVLTNMMLFPKKFVVPLQNSDPGQNQKYLVSVKIISCANLVAADMNGAWFVVTWPVMFCGLPNAQCTRRQERPLRRGYH